MALLSSTISNRSRRTVMLQPPRRVQVPFLLILLLVLLSSLSHLHVNAYVSPQIRQRWKEGYTFDQAIQTIEECAELGEVKNGDYEDLFCAVKFIDRFASTIHYRTQEAKEKLMENAKGSWELRLALTSDKDQEFYPHPEFRNIAMAFITVDDEYFGKGIAPSSAFCFVSIAGPSSQNINTRQVFMDYEDYYINGQTVPGWDLSYFLRGYQRNWVAAERVRPPLSFTVVAATDNMMVVRGSKTGGMAVFRRTDDMRAAAWGL